MEQKLRVLMIVTISLGYVATLAVSAGHLSEWYELTRGTLPYFLSYALAVTLEMNAFLLSLLSNSILRGSRWATGGALIALSLVWLGNYRSMERAAGDEVAWLEVFAMSLFVPVGTYVMGKIIGELLTLKQPIPVQQTAQVDAPVLQEVKPAPLSNGHTDLEKEVLDVIETGGTLRDIYSKIPDKRALIPSLLRSLQEKGLIENRAGLWIRRYESQMGGGT